MSFLAPFLSFLAAASNFFLIATIVAMIGRIYAARKGNRRLFHRLSWALLIASVPLALLYAFAGIAGRDLISLLLAGLWGWNAWTGWKSVRR